MLLREWLNREIPSIARLHGRRERLNGRRRMLLERLRKLDSRNSDHHLLLLISLYPSRQGCTAGLGVSLIVEFLLDI